MSVTVQQIIERELRAMGPQTLGALKREVLTQVSGITPENVHVRTTRVLQHLTKHNVIRKSADMTYEWKY